MTAEERNALVMRHLPLARKIANDLYYSMGCVRHIGNLEDVEQECLLALVRVVERFDPTRGVKFSTYAYRSLHNEIFRIIYDRTLIRIPSGTAAFAVREGTDGGQRQRASTRKDALRAINQVTRLPPMHESGLLERDSGGHEERAEVVASMLRKLPRKDRDLIRRRFGLGKHTPCRLEQLASEEGVTKQAIQQRLSRVYQTLRSKTDE